MKYEVTMIKEISFGKIAYCVDKRINEIILELELQDKGKGLEFACSGKIWNSKHTDIIAGGQCLDSIHHVHENNELFQEIKELWHKYHLNGMHVGTERQEQALKEYHKTNGYDGYTEDCKYLDSIGLLEDKEYIHDGKPYRYGTAWLYRAIPENDLNRIKEIIENGE